MVKNVPIIWLLLLVSRNKKLCFFNQSISLLNDSHIKFDVRAVKVFTISTSKKFFFYSEMDKM